jgi:TRAP-type C4-dicarboxylate transport system substrate-binding protein
MKKTITLTLVFVLMLVLSVGCGGTNDSGSDSAAQQGASSESTASGETVRLSLSNQWGANAYINTDILPRWKAELEEATNGAYTIDIYPANTLSATPENYEGVVNRISDLGMVTFSVTPGRFPVIEAFMLPGVANFKNATGAGYALNEMIEELDLEEVKDTHFLFAFSTGANVLLSKNPITSLEDIAGLTLGSTQAERANALTLMGANPVPLSMPEWFEALQKNMIVGGITSPEALEGFSLYEVTGDYILDWPYFNTSMFYCVMNIDTYNSLSDEAKAFFDQVPDYVIESWDYLVPRAIQVTEDYKSVTINTLTDEESRRWLDKLAPMITNNIDSLNAKGFDGAELHRYFQEIADKYNELYPHDLFKN